jgi:Flp pilus assembly protein TadD
MQPLDPPDSHFLSAAIGWLGLGNAVEARAELDQVCPARQQHPDVLEARWLICAEQKRWEEALDAARALLRVAPDRSSAWLHQAYALRRVPSGTVRQAWDALRPAFDKFPTEPIIPYNLACYACQMQDLEGARLWLQRAMTIGEKEAIRRMALEDDDLEPLREWTRSI